MIAFASPTTETQAKPTAQEEVLHPFSALSFPGRVSFAEAALIGQVENAAGRFGSELGHNWRKNHGVDLGGVVNPIFDAAVGFAGSKVLKALAGAAAAEIALKN